VSDSEPNDGLWQDKTGNDRYTTEIVANEMQMLGSRGGMGGGAESSGGRRAEPAARPAPPRDEFESAGTAGGRGEDFDDDIPF